MFLNHLDEITQLSANIGAQVVHYLQRCIILPGLGDMDWLFSQLAGPGVL